MSQVQSLIDHGRSVVAEVLIDTGTITRPSTASPALNTTTGVLTPAAGTPVHAGPCRVRIPTAQEQTLLFGDEPITQQRFVIWFPHDIPAVEVGDIVTVVSTGDSMMAARRFRVAAVESKSVLHSRRLAVETVEEQP